MPHSKVKRGISRFAGIAGLGLLAWLGNHAGYYMARGGWFQGSAAPGKSSRGVIPVSAAEHAKSEPVKSVEVAAVLKRLRAIAMASPNLAIDFEAHARIDAILGKLSAGELAAIFGELDSDQAGNSQNSRLLVRMVGRAWVRLDATSALSAAVAKSKTFGQAYASDMFGDWSMDEPEAALGWLNGKELPPELEEMKDELRGEALYHLMERDFELATSEFLKMGEGKGPWRDPRNATLTYWAQMYVDEPGMRERLVEFAKSTGKPEDYAELNKAMLREWTQDDPLGMLDYLQGLRGYLESDAVPVEKRPEVDGTAVGAAIYREYTRPAMEWWMERYSQSAETPMAMREAFVYWIHQRPDELKQWFAEQPESPQRDALNSAAATTFTANSKFQDAAQRVEQINDPEMRQTAVERLAYVWSAKDAQAAEAWRARQ